jgi:hypothetical protein
MKSRKIDVSNFLRMKDFGLRKGKSYSPHLVVSCSTPRLMTTCQILLTDSM